MKKNLATSIISIINEVKGIEKSLTIGNGNSAYKGVSDQEVKKIIGAAMVKHGLCIIPTKITPTIRIDRWEMDYQGQKQQKQSVFTEVITEYLLIHPESGESQVIAGYGHGVDSQDKSAGKATTYALKYALLYLFLVPTGKIDDADTIHSDHIATPQLITEDKRLFINQKLLDQLIERINSGDKNSYAAAVKVYRFTDEQRADLEIAYQTILEKIKWQK